MKHTLTLFAALTSGLLLPLLAADAPSQARSSSAAAPYPVAKFSIEHAVINQVYPQWSPKMPVDSRPVVWVQPSSDIGVLHVDGMSIYQNDPRSAQTPVVQVDGHIDLLSVNNVTLFRPKEMPIAGSLVRTDPDRTKLRQYFNRSGRSVLNASYPWAVGGRGWPDALQSLERKPQINQLHLSNITANRIKSVLQHDIGEIGQLQLDNIMTSEVPNPISVSGAAKIGEISSTTRNEK